MSDDFGEFCSIVGKEVPVFRNCSLCNDIEIVNSETYENPKTICDPGYCERAIPFCICRDLTLCDLEELETCNFPNCPRVPPIELPDSLSENEDDFDDC